MSRTPKIKIDRDTFFEWHDKIGTERQITLSNTIMQEYAKKHLKPLENDSLIINIIEDRLKEVKDQTTSTINNETTKRFGKVKSLYGRTKFEFNSEYKKELEKATDQLFQEKKRILEQNAQRIIKEKMSEIEEKYEKIMEKKMAKYEENLEEKMKSHFEGLLSKYLKIGL